MSEAGREQVERGAPDVYELPDDRDVAAANGAVPRFAALIAIIIGGLVLPGWAFGIEILKRIAPGLVAMNPATAVCFVLGGVSLWLQQGESSGRPRPATPSLLIARMAAWAVLAVSGLKLAEVLCGLDIGIDRLLFAARLEAEPGGMPNRMAPNTALNLCLIGGALLLLDVRQRRGPLAFQVLALLAAVQVLLAISGYLYNISSFYVVGTYIPMALHTAIAMGVLITGILFARPHCGVMAVITSDTAGGITARRLLPPAVLVPAVLGWLRLAGERHLAWNSASGASIFAVSTMLFLAVIIWWTAGYLDREEARRREVERDRSTLYRQLDSVSLLNQRMMKYSLDIICTIDAEGRFTQVSPASHSIWGYSPKQLKGRRYIEFVHPDDVPKTVEAARAIMSGHSTSNFENRYVRADGAAVPMLWSAVWSESDQTMFCVARDNTERHQTQEELLQSGRLLEKAQYLARLGSWEWDIASGAVAWSDELYRILGFQPGEIAPAYEAYMERVHAEDRDLVERNVRDALAGEGLIDFDYRIVRPDGSQRIVHARGEVAFGEEARNGEATVESGRPLRVMGSIQDITERKLIEEQLERARQEAERANTARSEFLSRMSHELRTPLNAILGFAQLLEMDALEQQQRDAVDQILRGGRHLLHLINEVLDIASIDAGRLSLSSEAVQLSEVVGEVATLLAPLVAEHKLTLDNEVSGREYVKCDRHRLKQVLLNLVSNAIKYNRPGGTVTISLAEAQAVGKVRFEISDSGLGISPAGMEKLFAPFERLDALQRGVEGTGIGLTITQRLIRLMDGEIGVRSQQGQGSTFWVELPAAQDPMNALEEQSETPPEIIELAPRPGHTILSIEDNLSNLKLIERILERRPEIKLLAAMQGRLGLELAREHLPSLILLDLHLPDISGDDVLRHLRAEDLTRNIPVVMVSADATPKQIERLLEIGARAYLTKPLNVAEFLRVLDEALPK